MGPIRECVVKTETKDTSALVLYSSVRKYKFWKRLIELLDQIVPNKSNLIWKKKTTFSYEWELNVMSHVLSGNGMNGSQANAGEKSQTRSATVEPQRTGRQHEMHCTLKQYYKIQIKRTHRFDSRHCLNGTDTR